MRRGRSPRVPVCAGLLVVVMAATACTGGGARDSADGDMAPAARTYLSKALDIMEEHSLRRRQVDWTALRRSTFAQAHGARGPADTYEAIEVALSRLGDRHSQFWDPAQAKAQLDPSATPAEPPRSRSLGHGVGYLALPGVDGAQKTYDTYVRQGRDAVARTDRAGACGWVVDLRGSTGGGMWPVLAVAGPVLGDGTVGAFVDADGKKSVWSVKDGTPYQDGTSADWGAAKPLAQATPPVAVLTGGATRSAGEAVVIAFHGRPHTRFFGEPTQGLPTGNASYPLPDGALLLLTGAREADRTGRVYDGPIPPDEEVVRDPRPAARDRDDPLDAARAWLLAQEGCRRS
ncbi:S41 family peptidase [Streptomyces sp. NPDC057197]|uniref:S41 family peptidase n=1 Tax=Streptomyces sp. NPDC057197 TaxID=3346045 RepID=UPI00363A1C7B